MELITERLSALPDFLTPLRDSAKRYVKYRSEIGTDGVVNIGHRPWVAELNYMLMLYPGANRESLDQYCSRCDICVPPMYAEFLYHVNGAFCFGMSLFCVPRSWPLLDRQVLRCHDPATAVKVWKEDYRLPDSFFHFGSRHFSFSKNVGYFIDENSRIVSVAGKKKIIGEWQSFSAFLVDELRASEQPEEELYPSKWKE